MQLTAKLLNDCLLETLSSLLGLITHLEVNRWVRDFWSWVSSDGEGLEEL